MEIVQNILVVITVVFAIWIIYSKFFKKKKGKKSCGGGDCGCS